MQHTTKCIFPRITSLDNYLRGKVILFQETMNQIINNFR